MVSCNNFRFLFTILFLSLFSFTLHAQEETKQYSDMSLDELLTIDVSVASKKSESISNTPAVVSSIKMDDMKSFGVRTLYEALAHVPGVVVQETPIGTISIMIRGISETFNQKVLFLLEGVPYYMTSHGDMPLLSMPVDMIDRIEVIHGPGSVIYGTKASAGVINVILKKDSDRSAVSLSSGSQGLLNAEANLSRKTENGYYYFGGSYQSMSKGYEAFFPITNLVAPFNTGKQVVGKDTLSFPTSGSITKKQEYYDFVAGGKFKNLNFIGHIFKQTYNGLGGAPVIMLANRLSYQGILLHADYTQKISNIDFNIYADHNPFFLQFDIDNFLATKNQANIVTTAPGKQEYVDPFTNNFRTRGGFTASYPFSENMSLMLGVENEYRKAGEYQKTDANDKMVAIQSNILSGNEFSSFGQLDMTFGALRAVFGARYVNNELAGSNISPRFSLIYNIDESKSLKLLYSEGFSSPVLSQQDLYIPFVISGNRDVKAEIIRSVDFAFTSSTPAQIIVVNGYYLSTKDVITRIKPAGAAEPKYFNSEGFDRFGAEVDYQKAFGSLLLISNASYNAQGNKDYTDDILAKFVPALSFNVGLRYRINEMHSIGLSERFWSERGGVAAQNITNLAYNLALNKFSIFVNLENIFDQAIMNPDVNVYAVPYINIPGGPGRCIYAGIKYAVQ